VIRPVRTIIAGAAALLAFSIWTLPVDAHKPITSKYKYNEDVFPIFRDRCGRCHVTDGVAPMSLLNYTEAFPWSEAIRVELIAEQFPPWHKTFAALPAHAIDVMMVWASGGNPQGDAAKKPPAVTLTNDWTLGPPDLTLQMPVECQLAADKVEDTHELVLATGLKEERTVRAVDLLPGTPAIVRDAVIYLKARAANEAKGAPSPSSADGNDAPGIVLANWMAGDAAEPLATPVRLPAGAELVLRVHYKKTWKDEGQAMTDRSTIGLYFASGREIGGR
jgi:hypothetical protein